MKKLITLILSIGFGIFCSFDEAGAMQRRGRGGGKSDKSRYVNKQHGNQQKEKAVESHSNQCPQDLSLGQQSSEISTVESLKEITNFVKKLELEESQSSSPEQNQVEYFAELPLSGDNQNSEKDPIVTMLEGVSNQLGNSFFLAPEHHEVQDQDAMIKSSASQDLQNDFEQNEIIGDNQDREAGELKNNTPENTDLEVKKEIEIEEEKVDVSDTQASQAQVSKLFSVVFKNNQEKDVFAQCNNYNFCEFMLNALRRMTEPETVSMVRHYGFGLGHVPLLLVWSSHLFDRLEQSRTYCMETQDLKDILILMLIIDLRAQVDAACIEHMKKNSHSSSLLALQTDNKIIESSTASAPFTAGYLKDKLAKLWSSKIQDMYSKKKLPRYTTILQTVKRIANEWQDEQLQSPIWVCYVKHQSYMLFNNFLGGWPADRFGNWWNPDQSLIIACQGCDYSDIRKPTAEKVLAELEKYTSWSEYFGDIYKLVKVDNAEYDSDGGF